VVGGTDVPFLRGLLRHEHESVRAWAIRFLTDGLPIDTIYSKRAGRTSSCLLTCGTNSPRSPRTIPRLVRLVLASTLQRLPVGRRAELAEALCRGPKTTPITISAIDLDRPDPGRRVRPDALVRLALACRLPNVLRLVARRLGEEIEAHPGPWTLCLQQQPVALKNSRRKWSRA